MIAGGVKFACVALFWGIGVVAAAADPPVAAIPPVSDLGQLTLRQAEVLFASRNREVQLAQRALEGAEADRISASARPNPSLTLGPSNITRQFPQGYEHNGLDRRFATTMSVSQTFERGNKRELRMDAAEFNVQATRGDAAEIRRQQRVALYGAYFDLVLAQERLRISTETAQLFRKTLDAVNLRLKAGDIAPADVARISVDAYRAQNDARAAQGEREKTQTVLGYLIGAEREARRIQAADGWPEATPAPTDIEIEAVLSGRADVAAAQARVQAAEKARELALALRARDVTIGVQFTHSPWDPVSNGTSGNTWGFGVSVPLFVNYNYEGEIRRAEVDLTAARENFERVKALALGEITRARADLDSATDRVRRFRDVLLKEAHRAADAAEFAYTRGALGVMDLLDARRQLYAARLEAAAAQADYARALSAWQAAVAASAPQPANAAATRETS